MVSLYDKINELKIEKDVAILAHYYVSADVQDVADYVGDSYYLSEIATTVPQKNICICGVYFMGESAKILNPEKTVLLPELRANCPMAHMADVDSINKVKEEHDDLAVVCYVNSTAELKANSDVCVTSANAMKIVSELPNKNIYFIPDQNLGRYIAGKLPDKNFIFNDGYCHVHAEITKDQIMKAKDLHPNAMLLMHPECTEDVQKLADYIGSTSGIINYATNSDAKEFIICTELGVFHELQKKNPDKIFYPVSESMICPNMKLITLDKVYNCLKDFSNQIEISEDLHEGSLASLKKMLELAKK